jgi:hypothetical protein
MGSNEIRDKRALTEQRKLIESVSSLAFYFQNITHLKDRG